MSIEQDNESSPLVNGSVYIPLRHRERPLITSTEQAIAYVEKALAEPAPWPEEVTVVEAASLEGRLEVVRLTDASPQSAKVHAIGAAVRDMLNALGMSVRMPHLAIVSGEYAEVLWNTLTYRVLGDDALAASGLTRQAILGLLREAGDHGAMSADLCVRFDETAQDDAVRTITRTSFMEHLLRQLRADGLAEISPAGRWRLTPEATATAAALPFTAGTAGHGKPWSYDSPGKRTAAWEDDAPVSQGKILTAVLQGREDDAAAMLAGWSLADLQQLATAAGRLGVLAATASHPRRPETRHLKGQG